MYTRHLFGSGEGGGRVERVNTLSQFDAEVSKAYKTDRFFIKRLDGLLNVKLKWNFWLGYSKYGTPRNTSEAALLQGGRQEEPMCMFFFKSKHQVTLMKYKYKEIDPEWMPYTSKCEGIPVFSETALALGQDMFSSPEITQPKAWPDMDKVSRYLQNSNKLTAAEKREWTYFFDNIPNVSSDIPHNKRFKFLLPELATRHQAAMASEHTPMAQIGESTRPTHPDECICYEGFTEADSRRAAKQRAENFAREQNALKERRFSEQLASRNKRPRAVFENNSSDGSGEDSSDTDSDSEQATTSTAHLNPDGHQHSSCALEAEARSSTVTSKGEPRPRRAPKSKQKTCKPTSVSPTQKYGDSDDSAETDHRNESSLSDDQHHDPLPISSISSGKTSRPVCSSQISKAKQGTSKTPKTKPKPNLTKRRITSAPEKRSPDNSLAMGNMGVITIADILMFSPDEASRAVDRKNKYYLGINLCKVIDIDFKSRQVQVHWYHGTSWTRRGRWIEWYNPVNNEPYTDWVDADKFLQESYGSLAKITLEKGSSKGRGVYAISLASVRIVSDVLASKDDLTESN